MKNRYVLMCCLTAAIGGFSFGYGELAYPPSRPPRRPSTNADTVTRPRRRLRHLSDACLLNSILRDQRGCLVKCWLLQGLDNIHARAWRRSGRFDELVGGGQVLSSESDASWGGGVCGELETTDNRFLGMCRVLTDETGRSDRSDNFPGLYNSHSRPLHWWVWCWHACNGCS